MQQSKKIMKAIGTVALASLCFIGIGLYCLSRQEIKAVPKAPLTIGNEAKPSASKDLIDSQLTLSDGTKIKLSTTVLGVTTVGAPSTTPILKEPMRDVIEKLKAENQITPQQVNQLEQLINDSNSTVGNKKRT